MGEHPLLPPAAASCPGHGAGPAAGEGRVQGPFHWGLVPWIGGHLPPAMGLGGTMLAAGAGSDVVVKEGGQGPAEPGPAAPRGLPGQGASAPSFSMAAAPVGKGRALPGVLLRFYGLGCPHRKQSCQEA